MWEQIAPKKSITSFLSDYLTEEGILAHHEDTEHNLVMAKCTVHRETNRFSFGLNLTEKYRKKNISWWQ